MKKDMCRTSEKLLLSIIYIIFFVYVLITIRIILFKDVPIYAIFKGGFRSVNLIPFYTVWEFMTDSNISLIRAIANIIGNIGIFIPMGIFLPVVLKKLDKKTIIIIISLISLGFELIQYILAIGSSDIDDVLLNSLGGILGIIIYTKVTKLFPNNIKKFQAIISTSIVLGVIGLGVIVTNYQSLLTFKLKPDKQVSRILVEENKEIIKDIDKNEGDIIGSFESFKNGVLTIKTACNNNIKSPDNLMDKNGNIKVYLSKNTKLISFVITEGENKDIIRYEEFDAKNLPLLKKSDTFEIWIDKYNRPKDEHGITAARLLIGLDE
ncbi:VanZ family protein [Clostridioides sp. ES-S-0145-01]|uniref:VanZ family protein n=1 Tax=Clostridioides sp. ES-S-0145-01 TaxID=2770784 RepID=UPI001D11BE45